MLPNAYFLAKFRFDTAKNEPAKICKHIQKRRRKTDFRVCPLPDMDLDEVCPLKKRIPVALGTATAGVVDPRRRGKDKTESHLSSKPLLTTIEHAYM